MSYSTFQRFYFFYNKPVVNVFLFLHGVNVFLHLCFKSLHWLKVSERHHLIQSSVIKIQFSTILKVHLSS